MAMMNPTHDPAQVPGSDPNPASPDHAPVKSTTETRSGVTFGTMRWVLTISIIAVVIIFGLALDQHAFLTAAGRTKSGGGA
jgi:hypothetical protein